MLKLAATVTTYVVPKRCVKTTGRAEMYGMHMCVNVLWDLMDRPVSWTLMNVQLVTNVPMVQRVLMKLLITPVTVLLDSLDCGMNSHNS